MMKLLLENWREFSKEEQAYHIYCDMDGVLVDFVKGVVEQTNKNLKDPAKQTEKMKKLKKALEEADEVSITLKDLDKHAEPRTPLIKAARDYMYSTFANDEEFWATLPWMPDGQELWNAIRPFKPDILTTPMGPGSERGKQRWVEEHLKLPDVRVFFSREKYEKVKNDNYDILIDDFSSNTIPWKNAKGTPILHTSAARTKKELKDLGLELPEEDI